MKTFIYADEFGNAARMVAEDTNTLGTLQSAVGGLITIVDGVVGGVIVDVVANDEGLGQFSMNYLASYIARQPIVGPVVLTRHDHHGDTVGLTDAQIAKIEADGLMLDEKTYTVDEIVALREKMLAEA
jgi:hypothetical protein